MQEIKPCPFCGAKAKLYKRGIGQHGWWNTLDGRTKPGAENTCYWKAGQGCVINYHAKEGQKDAEH